MCIRDRYGSSQFLNIFRSTDGGLSFKDIAPGAIVPIFSAPYELAPSNPRVLYAGGRLLFKSTDRGNNWNAPNPNFIDGGNSILNITVSPHNLNHLLVSTAPNNTEKANVFLTNNGGLTWTLLTGLPDRLATDLAFHPTDENIAFIVYSGFNTFHIYQTIDGGLNWFPIDNNLPDIPHNAIIIDPNQPDHIYIGNDLGIYASDDGGGNWFPFMEGLPQAILAMHLSISPANQKLRVATHGNGVYQTDLIGKLISSTAQTPLLPTITLSQNFPNPVQNKTTIPFSITTKSNISLKVFDIKGRLILNAFQQENFQGTKQLEIDLHFLTAGTYVYQLSGIGQNGQAFKQSKLLQKL